MPILEREVGHLTIYGDWDDTYGHQVIVHWGEAGPNCTVFVLGGQDYGGGIVLCGEVDCDKAQAIVTNAQNNYTIHDGMLKLLKESGYG